MRAMALKTLENKIAEMQKQYELLSDLCDKADKIIEENKYLDSSSGIEQIKFNIAYAFYSTYKDGENKHKDLISTEENVKNMIKIERNYSPYSNKKENYLSLFKNDEEMLQILDNFNISSYILNNSKYDSCCGGSYFRRS